MNLEAVQHRYEDLETAQRAVKARREDLREAVRKARKDHTLADIGRALGMTRQGVYDLLNR